MDKNAAYQKERNLSQVQEDKGWLVEFCRNYWPDQCAHIVRIADDAARGEFLFDLPWDMEQTSEPVRFEGEIDWQYMPDGDPEFIYQFNRHRYWISLGQAYALTGNEKYAQCFACQLMSWLDKNPITEQTQKTTWRTIEAGIRGENWVKAMEYFEDSPAVTEEVRKAFIQGLYLHGDYLLGHRSPFSDKSNWGVLESHGLHLIGLALSRAGAFGGWKEVKAQAGKAYLPEQYIEEALIRLKREISIQVMDEGVHWEQSPMYHNEVLRCLLAVLAAAKKAGEKLPELLCDKARAMAHADVAWMKPDRTQPLSGDSDRTDLRDVFTPAAYLLKDEVLRYCGYDRLDFESAWELGAEAAMEYEQIRPRKPDKVFFAMEQSGHWCLRSGWGEDGDYLHFKCGSLGGGHGHFDKLHMDLSICGEDVLVDGGRFTYVDGTLRRFLKSTRAHNAPMVDLTEYGECLDSWNTANTAPALGQSFCQRKMEDGQGAYTLVQGAHCGYRSQGVLVTRKIICLATRAYVVADTFWGKGSRLCSQMFHFNPFGRVEKEERSFLYQGTRAHAEFTIITDEAKAAEERCPISFHYNKLEHGTEISVSKKGILPFTLITVITAYQAGEANPYAIEQVPVTVPVTGRTMDKKEAEAVRIQDGKHSWIIIINHGDTCADGEYIGAAGRFGLGRVMVCDENVPDAGMTVLQW